MSFTPVPNLPPVSLKPGAICHPHRWHQRQICRRYCWHRWQIGGAPWLANFRKNLKLTLLLFSGAWGKVIMKKTWSKKSRDTVSLNINKCKIYSFISGNICFEFSVQCFWGNVEGKLFSTWISKYFVWTPLGSRVNMYINFCLQVHFKVSAVWYYSHYLPPVLLTPVAICHRRRWHWRQICRRYRWHRWQVCHRCRWYRWCTLTCKKSPGIFKKFEIDPNFIFRGLGEGDSWKKPEAKNLVTLSL